ncbi:MAG: hypothetical protein AAFW73_15900 [Bacteroidota bacterium]
MIQIEIELDEYQEVYHLGTPYSGRISVELEEAVEVHRLGYRLVVELRGLVEVYEHTIVQEILVNRERLAGDKPHVFPFEFVNHHFETFKGKRFSLHLRIEGFLEMPPQTITLPNRGLRRLTGPSRTQVEQPRYQDDIRLRYRSSAPRYRLPTEATSFAVYESISWWIPLILIGLLPVGYHLSGDQHPAYFIPLFVLGFLISIVAILWIGRWTQAWRFRLSELEETHFELRLERVENWRSIQSVEVWYEIEEEVIDRRGTSPTTNRSTLFRSESVRQRILGSSLGIKLPLPVANQPAGIVMGDAKIHWLAKVRVRLHWGLRFTLRGPFLPQKM